VNSIFLHRNLFSLSLATITLLSAGLSVSAQTVDETSNQQLITPSKIQGSLELETEPVKHFSPSFTYEISEKPSPSVNDKSVKYDTVPQGTENFAPVPGTTATSSALLTRQYPQVNLKPSISSDVAQADIDFGGATSGGSSYIGVAGNIGLGGDSALGDGNFMVISKVGLTDILSVRPSLVLGNDTVILVPVTYDFSFKQVTDPFREPLPFTPYVGGGLAYQTGDDSELTFLLSGGVDVPLTNKLTATAALNAAFFDETDLGLSVGVGYNFGGF